MRQPLWITAGACCSLAVLFTALHAANPDYRSKDHPLGDFHRWTKVNDAPHILDDYIMELCRSPTEIEQHQSDVNPHSAKDIRLPVYINVYVNEKGLKQMQSGAEFPAGAVIVKEQLAGEDLKPLRSTAMIKREPGYNPRCGDWEFDTLDAAGAKITSSGRNENCMSCHAVHKRNDHTFRFYLPIHDEGEHQYVRTGRWEIFPYMPYDY